MAGNVLRELGVEHPIILAPMAGGIGSPELVGTVSNAGGLGSWAGAYATPQQILDAAKAIRTLTGKPFALNLFAGGYGLRPEVDAAPMLAKVAQAHAKLGLPPPVLPPNPDNPFEDQFAAVIEARPALFSFTFGIPNADALARLRRAGIRTCGTATTVQEARALEQAGVESIVAQGEEAGAHRGTFIGSMEDSMVPTLELTRATAAAVSVPVFAAGGLMDGRDISRALAAGAQAGQLGTAFIVCPESGAAAPYKQALIDARAETTVITRAYSGREARGLRNAFIDMTADIPILPFRQQNDLTRPMRTESGKKGTADYISLWAGRGVTRARAMPAEKLMETLIVEIAGA